MPSRIILKNKVAWSSGWPAKAKALFRDTDRDGEGNPIDYAAAIPPESATSVFRAGSVVFHPGDKINYRLLDCLPPLDGWASTDFWQDRWNVDHKAILAFAERGYLDPAMETGSQICRFRCRDEYRLKISDIWRLHKNRLIRATKARNKSLKQQQEAKESAHANTRRRFGFQNRG